MATTSRLQSWQTTSHVFFASPFSDTVASETSRSEKLHNNSGATVCSLQDRTNNRALGGPRKTNQYTLLTLRSAMRASEKIARDPQVWSNPVGLGVRSERGLLRKRVFTADKEALFSRSTLFNSASSRNSQPKDSFPVSLLLLGEDKW